MLGGAGGSPAKRDALPRVRRGGFQTRPHTDRAFPREGEQFSSPSRSCVHIHNPHVPRGGFQTRPTPSSTSVGWRPTRHRFHREGQLPRWLLDTTATRPPAARSAESTALPSHRVNVLSSPRLSAALKTPALPVRPSTRGPSMLSWYYRLGTLVWKFDIQTYSGDSEPR